MFAAADQRDVELIQLDVKTAFLHRDLEETIYMQLPEGFEGSNNKVCKLNKGCMASSRHQGLGTLNSTISFHRSI